ncbi:hypothetical protein [Paracoccus aerius]|uniref:Uncharacterized protein n=1 Tax=Paracoccus aerius TaxID=1915382 RepID=A0ABS1S2D4_9RHOB|nr:hypothetical protein [Paracoccus aerius]MBL3672863.1 hypothetical protein [Paracoccus aerius]GHG15816.1 hypothetical protein GCM10017322_10420 [Paracoccus aerius]
MTKHDAPASAEEQRALSRDEQDLADQARQPALGQLKDRDLSDLVSRLRDRRNRARDLGNRQGREARGKADPSGATAAGGNEGMRSKLDYLNDALDRATAERDRRKADGPAAGDRPDQVELAQKALAAKQSAAGGPSETREKGAPLHPNDPDADQGKRALAETERRTAPSGAFDHAGDLPARERSRTRH